MTKLRKRLITHRYVKCRRCKRVIPKHQFPFCKKCEKMVMDNHIKRGL